MKLRNPIVLIYSELFTSALNKQDCETMHFAIIQNFKRNLWRKCLLSQILYWAT